MMSALLSFLGGSAFRMIWGEVSTWLTKKQDHRHEMEMMQLQADLDARRHAMQLDAIREQAKAGVQVIEAQREAAGITQGMIRVAVGLEDLDDLKADLARGLDTLTA